MSPKTPDPTHIHGLKQTEARRRLQAEGLNESSTARSRDIPAIALEVVRDYILVLAAGDRVPADAAMICHVCIPARSRSIK